MCQKLQKNTHTTIDTSCSKKIWQKIIQEIHKVILTIKKDLVKVEFIENTRVISFNDTLFG